MVGYEIDGRYRLDRRLERGGTGAIYAGEQLRVGRPVAVKILRAALAEEETVARRFEREAEIISHLEHPNTLKLFDFGWLRDGRPYLVTELLHGENLADRLSRGRLSIGASIRIATAVLESLSEAHGKGIVHRDLKPSNVFLQLGDRVRVLDFGIARMATSITLTEPGMIMGTPAYMSPEQSLKDVIDGRSDLYSVGAILFECLTGRPPFLADTAQTMILKHGLMQAPRLNQVSHGFAPELDALMARLLSKAPELRPQDARECIEELAPFRDSDAIAPDAIENPDLEAAYAPEVITPLALSAPSLPALEPTSGGRGIMPSATVTLAAAGLALLFTAGVLGFFRAVAPSRIDVQALAPPASSVEAFVPAIPAPLLAPPGRPAPLLDEFVEQAESQPDSEPASTIPRIRAPGAPPPGYVHVRL